MVRSFLRWIGVTPDGAKTGKREAAWAIVAVTLLVTDQAMFLAYFGGVDFLNAMMPVLIAIWPSAISLVGFAYKLDNDKKKSLPAGWPPEIAAPGPAWEPGDNATGAIETEEHT